MAKNIRVTSNTEKEFLDTFKELCYTRQSWQVWTDFIFATACSLANSVDREGPIHDQREAEYKECIERLEGVDKAAQLLACVVKAFEENPEQDFLGNLFMNLDLGSHWKGQFFTPYCLARAMGAMQYAGVNEKMAVKGYASVLDPACGAGVTLIATANVMKENGINYQQNALFVGQDIDRVAGLMCYIQLSILGCAGYIVIGDSLCNPVTGSDVLFPMEKPGQEIWYMPMFASDVWQWRRNFKMLDKIFAMFKQPDQ